MFELFKDPDGKVSMMRFLSFFVCANILLVFLIHNIVAVVHNAGFISMGPSEAMLIAGVLGAKAAQSFTENKNTKDKIEETEELPNAES